MKEKLTRRRSAAAAAGGKNRVAVFREEGSSFRKLKPNVLARAESMMANKSLKVPKVKQRPVCTFFLRGECHKDNCEFSHVNVGADAPVCEDFQKGYCELGEACPKRHVAAKRQPKKRKMDEEEKEGSDNDDNFIKLE